MDCTWIYLYVTAEDVIHVIAASVGILFLLLYAYAWGHHWHRQSKAKRHST